jgi:hypothetical protein
LLAQRLADIEASAGAAKASADAAQAERQALVDRWADERRATLDASRLEREALLDRIQDPMSYRKPLPPLGEPEEAPVDESGMAGTVRRVNPDPDA